MKDNTQKLVSVIIAAYNSEQYISQAIESVCAQTHRNIEVIVIDDGSTDGTRTIVEAYAKADNRIRIITQSNKGPSAARNAGFRAATGEYFSIVDADDIVLPLKIQTQLAVLEEAPSVDFCYSNVYYFIDGTYTLYRHDLITASGPAVYKKLIQYGNFIYTSTVFFRRAVFDRWGGFDEGLHSAEEFDYWLLLAEHGVRFLHHDEYLTLCRSRGNGLTSDSVTMYSAAVAVFKKHLHTRFARMTSYQFLKQKALLYIARLRRPALSTEHQQGSVHGSGIRSYIHTIYTLLKKIKFSTAFKQVHDEDLERYLKAVESKSV